MQSTQCIALGGDHTANAIEDANAMERMIAQGTGVLRWLGRGTKQMFTVTGKQEGKVAGIGTRFANACGLPIRWS